MLMHKMQNDILFLQIIMHIFSTASSAKWG